MSKFGFIGAAYADDSPNVATQRCVNLYTETVQVQGEPTVVALKQIPGMRTFGTLPTSPIKALFGMDAFTQGVGGNTFYDILANGTPVARGTMAINHNPATIACNGDGGQQMLVSSGQCVYVYNLTTKTFTQAYFREAVATPEAPVGTPDQHAGCDLAAGDYLIGVTAIDSTGGETLVSPGIKVTVAVGGLGRITLALTAPTGAAHMRVYISGVGGTIPDRYFTAVSLSSAVVTTLTGATMQDLPLTANAWYYTTAVPGDFVAFVGGFFLSLDVATSTFYVSQVLDGTIWDPTQVAQRSLNADRWRSMIVSHGEVWLFGSQTTDVWRDTGASPFPFAPILGVSIQQGILAPYSACVWNNGVVWLGANASGAGRVWFAGAYQPQEVSTTAINQAIASYATTADAVGHIEVWKGHEFYVLNFPSAGKTWALDAATGHWHERVSWDSTNGCPTTYRGTAQCYAFGQQLVGDRETGVIYTLDDTYFFDGGGGPLYRLRQCPHIANELEWIFHEWLQIDAEMGVGLATGQGSNPVLMIQWSDDGGFTWGNEHWVTLGKRGVYRARALIRQLGRSRNRVYRVSCTDPVFLCFVEAYLKVTGTGVV